MIFMVGGKMGKKKKKETEEPLEEEEVTLTVPEDSSESEPEEPKPAPKKTGQMFKAGEWAKQDSDKPDPLLFQWWDQKGVMPESEYKEIKKQVYRQR